MTKVHVELDHEQLTPIIRAVATEVLSKIEEFREAFGGRMAFGEDEAARMLGLTKRQLAEERRRGGIAASRIVGSRIRYTRDDLREYLLTRRRTWGPG